MSQSQWDYLEEHKQDIIEGKVLCKAWDFEVFVEYLEGSNNNLTGKEKAEVFERFPGYSSVFYETTVEVLEMIVEDVIKEREEAPA